MANTYYTDNPNKQVLTTDSFAAWIEKTNKIIVSMGTEAVTVTTVTNGEPNTTNGGLTTGNVGIAGVLTANTIAVNQYLRGGTVTVPAGLVITSNAEVQGVLTYIKSTNTTIGDDSTTDVLNVNAVSDFNANVNIDGILTQTANATFSGALLNITGANTTIGDAGSDKLNVNAESDFNANVNIDGIFTVTANAIFSGANLNINGNTSIGDLATDRLVVNATLSSDLIPLDNTIDLGSISNAYGNAHVTVVYSREISVSNNMTVSNTITVNTQANVASLMVSNLTATRIPYSGVGGQQVDSANLTFSGTNLNIIGTANVTSNANVGGTLGVTGLTTLSTANITSNANVGGTLGVTGLTTLSTANVTSNANVGGTLGVAGAFTAASTIAATGNITTSANLVLAGTGSRTIRADSTTSALGSVNLVVANNTTSNTVLVANSTGLFGSANVTYDLGSAGVAWRNITTRDATVANSITVTSTTTTNGLTISGISAVNRLLYTTTGGAVTSNDNITFNGSNLNIVGTANITSNANVGGTLGVAGAVTVSNTFAAGNTTITGNTTTTTLNAGNTAISGTLGVTSPTTVSNTFAAGNTTITGTLSAGNTTISGNTITTTLSSGNTTVTGTLGVAGNISAASNVELSGTGSRTIVAIDTGATAAQNSLTIVVANTSVTNTVMVVNSTGTHAGSNVAYDLGSATTYWKTMYARDVVVANSMSFTSANVQSMMVRDLTDGRITYSGGGTISGQLRDSANLTFSGTNLNVIGTANVTSNANVGGTLGVTGLTTLSTANITSTATIGGAATLNAALSVNGAITAANTLGVTGLTTLSTLNVTSTANVAGVINSTNNIITTANVVLSGSTSRTIRTDSGAAALVGFNLVAANNTTSNTVLVANTTGLFGSANAVYDLGSAGVVWKTVFANSISVANTTTTSNLVISSITTANRLLYSTGTGAVTSSDNITFNGTNLNVIGTANVTSNANVGGTLGVAGAFTAATTVNVTGLTTLSTVNITSNANVGGTLGVTGLTTLSTANVTSNANIGGTLGVAGAFTAASTLTVTGAATLSSDFILSGSGSKTIKADAGLSPLGSIGLVVANNTTSNTVLVANTTGLFGSANAVYDLGSAATSWKNIYGQQVVVANTLSVSGNTTVGGNLTVTGTLYTSGDINLTLNTATSTTSTVSSLLTVNGNTVLGDAVTDVIFFNAVANGNFIPQSNASQNIGNTSYQWANIYSNNIIATNISGNTSTVNTANYGYHSDTSVTATLATVTPTAIATFSASAYGSAEVTVTAKQGTARHISKLLIVHNGTTASATEYGAILTGSSLATYDVDISGGNVRLLATSASTSSTVYNVVLTLINA